MFTHSKEFAQIMGQENELMVFRMALLENGLHWGMLYEDAKAIIEQAHEQGEEVSNYNIEGRFLIEYHPIYPYEISLICYYFTADSDEKEKSRLTEKCIKFGMPEKQLDNVLSSIWGIPRVLHVAQDTWLLPRGALLRLERHLRDSLYSLCIRQNQEGIEES